MSSSEAQDGGLRAFIKVDREKAGRLGVSMQVVNDTLNDAFGQRQISTIYGQANQYRVILEAQPQYQRDPSALAKSTSGNRRPAATISSAQIRPARSCRAARRAGAAQRLRQIDRTTAPLAIAHQEQFPAATLSFNLAPGAALERRRVDRSRAAERDDRHADAR